MAIFINSSTIYEVLFVCKQGDQIGLNVRHYVSSPTFVVAGRTIHDFSVRLADLFSTLYPACLSENAEFRGVGVRPWTAPITYAYDFAVSGEAGTIAGDSLPSQVSGVIALKTGLSGRHYRGRSYIPFPGESVSNIGGRPDATYLTALQLLADQLATNTPVDPVFVTDDTDMFPAILNRVGATTQPVVQGIARNGWGTQRRRGAFGQTNLSPV
jgi:hypothetical protein